MAGVNTTFLVTYLARALPPVESVSPWTTIETFELPPRLGSVIDIVGVTVVLGVVLGVVVTLGVAVGDGDGAFGSQLASDVQGFPGGPTLIAFRGCASTPIKAHIYIIWPCNKLTVGLLPSTSK